MLLIAVAFSFRQTIFAFPGGGGAYVVTRDNLGPTAGLAAAASLLIDYTLTVAVSITAGVSAVTSAFPSLHVGKTWLSLGVPDAADDRQPARPEGIGAAVRRAGLRLPRRDA